MYEPRNINHDLAAARMDGRFFRLWKWVAVLAVVLVPLVWWDSGAEGGADGLFASVVLGGVAGFFPGVMVAAILNALAEFAE